MKFYPALLAIALIAASIMPSLAATTPTPPDRPEVPHRGAGRR